MIGPIAGRALASLPTLLSPTTWSADSVANCWLDGGRTASFTRRYRVTARLKCELDRDVRDGGAEAWLVSHLELAAARMAYQERC